MAAFSRLVYSCHTSSGLHGTSSNQLLAMHVPRCDVLGRLPDVVEVGSGNECLPHGILIQEVACYNRLVRNLVRNRQLET